MDGSSSSPSTGYDPRRSGQQAPEHLDVEDVRYGHLGVQVPDESEPVVGQPQAQPLGDVGGDEPLALGCVVRHRIGVPGRTGTLGEEKGRNEGKKKQESKEEEEEQEEEEKKRKKKTKEK